MLKTKGMDFSQAPPRSQCFWITRLPSVFLECREADTKEILKREAETHRSRAC